MGSRPGRFRVVLVPEGSEEVRELWFAEVIRRLIDRAEQVRIDSDRHHLPPRLD